MKVLTVAELHDILSALVKQGKGNRVVLVPNECDEDINADYRTIGFVDSECDIQEKYIYLETNNTKDENAYFEGAE